MQQKIDMRSLRSSLLAGALVGLVAGLLYSGPLRASASTASAAPEEACRILCASVIWLRAPVRYRGSYAGQR